MVIDRGRPRAAGQPRIGRRQRESVVSLIEGIRIDRRANQQLGHFSCSPITITGDRNETVGRVVRPRAAIPILQCRTKVLSAIRQNRAISIFNGRRHITQTEFDQLAFLACHREHRIRGAFIHPYIVHRQWAVVVAPSSTAAIAAVARAVILDRAGARGVAYRRPAGIGQVHRKALRTFVDTVVVDVDRDRLRRLVGRKAQRPGRARVVIRSARTTGGGGTRCKTVVDRGSSRRIS